MASSDSEDDPDYAPPTNDAGGPLSSDEERSRKRQRIAISPHDQMKEKVEFDRKKLWEEFKASTSTPDGTYTSETERQKPTTVKIEKRFRFAGEDVVEIKEVPEDSEEAKKWPRWRSPEEQQSALSTDTPTQSEASSAKGDHPPIGPAVAKPSAPSGSAGKRPGPRKPKTTLAAIPKVQAAKNLTTLDKSAMDWRAHVQTESSPDLKDELDANRRGGGYLGKVEFLQRVEDRKAEALDASTSKRRRG